MNQTKTLFDQRTFGPDCQEADVPRILTQMDVIREYMLRSFPNWLTLGEIKQGILHTIGSDYLTTSISAQLRHLKKPQFGLWRVEKRKRTQGTWEYIVYPKSGLI